MNDYPEDFPYCAPRMPVMARNMVASSQPLAVQAGIDVVHNHRRTVKLVLKHVLQGHVLPTEIRSIHQDPSVQVQRSGATDPNPPQSLA